MMTSAVTRAEAAAHAARVPGMAVTTNKVRAHRCVGKTGGRRGQQGTTGADGARKESADQCPPSLTGSSVQGRGGSPHSGVGQGASVRRVGRGTVHSAVRDAVDGMFVGCLWTFRSVRGQTFRFPRSGQARTWCAATGRFGSREGHACSVPPWAPRGPGGDSKCSMSVRW